MLFTAMASERNISGLKRKDQFKCVNDRTFFLGQSAGSQGAQRGHATCHLKALSVVHSDMVLSDKSRDAKHNTRRGTKPEEGPEPLQPGKERGARVTDSWRHWQRPLT